MTSCSLMLDWRDNFLGVACKVLRHVSFRLGNIRDQEAEAVPDAAASLCSPSASRTLRLSRIQAPRPGWVDDRMTEKPDDIVAVALRKPR